VILRVSTVRSDNTQAVRYMTYKYVSVHKTEYLMSPFLSRVVRRCLLTVGHFSNVEHHHGVVLDVSAIAMTNARYLGLFAIDPSLILGPQNVQAGTIIEAICQYITTLGP
jgi:hypothetical protein